MDVNITGFPKKIEIKGFDKIGDINILMVKGEKGDIGDAGDYSTLRNKPQINGVPLSGNKSASDLSLATETAMEQVQSDVSSLQSDIGTLQTNVSENTSDISDLESAVGTNTSNISSLTSTVNTHTGDISDLETAVANHTSDISDLETNKADASALSNYLPLSGGTLTGALVGNGKHNRSKYLPYSFSTGYSAGTAGYLRIATISILSGATAIVEPIHFKVMRAFESVPVDLYLKLAFTTNSDPAIESLYYEASGGLYNNTFNAFAVRTGAGVYDVYVEKPTGGSCIDVFTYITGFMQDKCSVTYSEAISTSVPSGAVMATIIPAVRTSPTLTRSGGSGTASNAEVIQSGNVVQFNFTLSYTTAISPPVNLWTGSVSDMPLPIKIITNSTWDGNCTIHVALGSGGALQVHAEGGNLSASSSRLFNCSLVYLTNSHL